MKYIWLFLLCLLVVTSLRTEPISQAKSELELGSTTRTFHSVSYRIFVAEPDLIRLHWRNPDDGENFSYFSKIKTYLKKRERHVHFLTNAGIYGRDYQPTGLHIEAGQLQHPININRTAKGNFHLQPNGIFFIRNDGHANVLTTLAYQKYYPKNQHIRLATQSGPMLVIDGKINAQFLEKGQSTHYRSGVCVIKQRVVFYKNTSEAVNFYEFASFAKSLGCRNALYLDGKISKHYEPGKDMLWHLSPFVGILSVTEKQD